VAALLREMDALRGPDVSQDALENRLVEITSRIDVQRAGTDRQLAAESSGATLDGLTVQWQAVRDELIRSVNFLARRATQLEEALVRLAALRESWAKTMVDARASRAPAPVLERIDHVLVGLAETSGALQGRRSTILILQDRVARQVTRCDDVLARISALRERARGGLLVRDSAPVWHPGVLAHALRDLPAQLRIAVAADVVVLEGFARDQRWKVPIHMALFVVLLLVMRAAKRRASRLVASGAAPAADLRVFDRHVSAALMLSFLAFAFIYTPPIPRVVGSLQTMLALLPALRIVQALIDPRLGPALWVLGGFFLVDLVRNSVSVISALERPILLLEMLAAALVLSWVWLSPRGATFRALDVVMNPPGPRVVRGVVLAACATAFVAGAAGYMPLALLVGPAIFGNGYLALVLYASMRVADGLVTFALSVRPLNRLGSVRRHRRLIERRTHGLLRWMAIVAWLVAALRYLGLWSAAVAFTGAALATEARLGSIGISLGDVLLFALTMTAAFVLSSLVRFTLEEEVYPRLRLARGLPQLASSFMHYSLLLIGFLLALAALGVDLTKVTILAGALGVGIGFGLQGVVNNFVSGSLVLVERKINVGDAVDIGGISGRVQHLGLRACTVRTWEGAEVIVPNASLTSEKVTNWTLSDRQRRIDVAVGVAYGTSPDTVLGILREVASAHPGVLKAPAPAALFLGFGESALRFELRVWTDFEQGQDVQSELSLALYAALGRVGIEIPVPQRELRLRPS
jgi:small-conductance mechanosensitive channel